MGKKFQIKLMTNLWFHFTTKPQLSIIIISPAVKLTRLHNYHVMPIAATHLTKQYLKFCSTLKLWRPLKQAWNITRRSKKLLSTIRHKCPFWKKLKLGTSVKNWTQVSKKIEHRCLKKFTRVQNWTLLSKIGAWCDDNKVSYNRTTHVYPG